MRCLRTTSIIAAFLIVAVSTPQSLYSQKASEPSPVNPARLRQRQSKRPPRAEALAVAINELLKLDPQPTASPHDNSSDISQDEEKPPADDAPIRNLIEYWFARRRAALKSWVPSRGPTGEL